MSENEQQLPEEVWEAEQSRVSRVVDLLDKRMGSLELGNSGNRMEITEIRREFWEDVTVNLDSAEEAAETYASMKQQAEVLAERERTYAQAHKMWKTWSRMRYAPYFARIDFKEHGDQESEAVYLGVGSLMDERDEAFLVYDWRAPISSVYYDYSPGAVSYLTPAGTINGEMEIKRQFVIREGQIESMFDTGLTIGDEMLQAVLGRAADSQMKTIVATIQREQNQIIRDERSRLLIVLGAAGSGKTSAALQRVAYLLYRYRETLSAEQILLFSPNPMFQSYVSSVLPELGEDNMQQMTYQEYLEKRLGALFTVEDAADQLEALHAKHDDNEDVAYKHERQIRQVGIAYKSSLHFLGRLDAYLEQLRTGETLRLIFKPIVFRKRVLLSSTDIATYCYEQEVHLSLADKLKRTADWILKQLQHFSKEERKAAWVEEAVELMDKEDYLEAHEQTQRGDRQNDFGNADREHDYLAAKVVQQAFKKLRRRVKLFRFVDYAAIYRQVFTKTLLSDTMLEQQDAIIDMTLSQLDAGRLFFEDATPMLYLREQIEGFRSDLAVRHVFIDEAQDYSPMQFAFLRKRYAGSKMTVLGDLNQAIHPQAAVADGLTSLANSFSADEQTTIRLQRSYRSTRPIVEFTRQLIAGGDQIEPFNRDGDQPVVHRCVDPAHQYDKLAEQIDTLLADQSQTVAIIGKTAANCRMIWEALKARLPEQSLQLVTTDTVKFEQGAVVIPVYLAKGVEFDAVLISQAEAQVYGEESDRQLFYTACTRAMHTLHIFYQGRHTPFLDSVANECYTIHDHS